ncbi:MAG: hypothetical protein WA445_27325 [Pseudolabrys sp.]
MAFAFNIVLLKDVGLRCALFDRNAETYSREVYCRSINDFALLDEAFD